MRTFASLRFRGDRLEPELITEILGAKPTVAYRKGDVFKQGRGHEARGRTGLWLLSSKAQVPNLDLDAHLRYLLAILLPGNSDARVSKLHDLMHEQGLNADIGCFWYGASGARPPTIAEDVRRAVARLPATIETDFHSD